MIGVIMLGIVVASPTSFEPIIIKMAQKYDVPVALIKATIQAESNWKIDAKRYEPHIKDSSYGLMQVLLSTARNVLNNPNLTATELIKPEVNIEAGTKYLGYQLKRYNRNILDAIAAYNAGRARKNRFGKYINQNYVDRVYNLYLSYSGLKFLAGPAPAIPILLAVGVIGTVAMFNMPEHPKEVKHESV